MRKAGLTHHASVAVALLGLSAPAWAQEQMIVNRGLTDDQPYTIIYPSVFESIDDGNPDTVATLRHTGATLQCDAFVVDGGADNWTAQGVADNLDVDGIEAAWRDAFQGFTITGQGVTNFASGPALLYEALADGSPLGIPVSIVHAEAVDNGKTFALECVLDRSVAADARPLINFLIANFSTRSDGECCIDPSDDRG